MISRALQLRKCGGAAGDTTGGAAGDSAGGAAGDAAGGAAGDAAGGAAGDAAGDATEGVLGLVLCYCGSGYLGDLLVLDDHLIFVDPV